MSTTRRAAAAEVLEMVAASVRARQAHMLRLEMDAAGLRCRKCRISALEILDDCGWQRAVYFVLRQRPHSK